MQKKICPKNEKLCIFEKPWTMPFQICKILNNLIFNQEKLKMSKFPLTGRLQKNCNFFSQNKDLVCYRKKQSFRQCAWGLRQLVLKPGFRPKGRAWVCKKSQKISIESDQYFLSYVKKTTGGGSNCPPPSRNRVKIIFSMLTSCNILPFFELWRIPLYVCLKMVFLRAIVRKMGEWNY